MAAVPRASWNSTLLRKAVDFGNAPVELAQRQHKHAGVASLCSITPRAPLKIFVCEALLEPEPTPLHEPSPAARGLVGRQALGGNGHEPSRGR
jgi:hypothetical protein